MTRSETSNGVCIAPILVEAHNDLLMLVVKRPRHRWGSYFRENWLPQLRKGGVTVQVLAIYVDHKLYSEAGLRETFRMIEAAHVIADENPDQVRLCIDRAEIEAAHRDGKIALFLAMEGCASLAPNLELLGQAHRLGVRMVSLVHMGRNAFADASDELSSDSGLSALGIEALREIEALGMIFDITHLNTRGVNDVIKHATQPVIASHSAAYSLRPHHRNLTDDQLRAVAAAGGIVCVNFMASFIATKGATVGDLVDHIDHIVDVTDIEHIGLGPDFVAEVFSEIAPATTGPGFEDFDPIETIAGLDGPAGLPIVEVELRRRSWNDESIAKLNGGNVLDLITRVCG
jgi:membrane dipeptidase